MDQAIKKELAALREEIEALRADARAARPAEAPPAGGVADDAADAGDEPKAWTDDVKDVIAALQGAVETTGSSVAVHPIAGVAAAFLAGLLIGRLTKIG